MIKKHSFYENSNLLINIFTFCQETVKGSNSRQWNVSHLTALVSELFTSVIQWWAPPLRKHYMIWCVRSLLGHIKAIRLQSSPHRVCKGQSLCDLFYCVILSILWPLYMAFHYGEGTISSHVTRSIIYILEIFRRTQHMQTILLIQSFDILWFQNR